LKRGVISKNDMKEKPCEMWKEKGAGKGERPVRKPGEKSERTKSKARAEATIRKA